MKLSTFFKKVLTLSLIVTVVLIASGMYLEPILADAASASDSVVVTLQVDTGITITSPADTVMSTNLGVAINSAIATTTWNVKTNNSLGYALTLAASTNPAMKTAGSDVINDFATTTTPEPWANIPNGRAEFGYSAFGTDVNTSTYGTPTNSSCGATSTPSTTLLYRGFTTSASPTIATRAATTTTAGIDTSICYAVEQKGFYIPSGTYTATITATATTL